MTEYVIEYEPRVEDPVIVARFSSIKKAEEYLAIIKLQRPKAGRHHKIIKIDREFKEGLI
tara:strand:+ start:924 stop:1103 length:180 start_codon:yes stop_codon:yes gene_type:complete